MKKINNYSAQFKIIQKPMNTNEYQFDEKKNNPKNNQKKIIKTKPRFHK